MVVHPKARGRRSAPSSMPHGAILAGSTGSARLRLTNTSLFPVAAPISITLYTTTDATLSLPDEMITTVSIPQVSLRSGQSKVMNLKFTYSPTLVPGSYYLVAAIQPAGSKAAPGQAVDPLPVTIRPAFVDLAGAFGGGAGRVMPGRNSTATLIVRNLGNATANGNLTIILYAASGPTLDSSAQTLAKLAGINIRIRPGKSLTLHLHFIAPQDKAPGTYDLIATLSAITQAPNQNAANNAVSIGTR